MPAIALTGSGRISSAGRIAGPRLTLPFRGTGAISSGGRINTGLVSQLTAKAVTIADRLASVAATTLTDSIDREWREELSEAGFGSFVLMQDNGLTSSIDWLPNTLVDFHIGSTLAYTILVEQYEAVDIDERAEEAGQLTRYKGRGHVALLDRILIYPALGPYKRPIEEDRAFNYTNPAYDDTAWVAANLILTVLFAKSGGWGSGLAAQEWDDDFPDDTAEILGPYAGNFNLAPANQTHYFRQHITVPTTGSHTLFACADNWGEVYMDGVLLLSPGQTENLEAGFGQMSQITVDITAGTHYIAANCTNAAGTVSNPTGIAWALYTSDSYGTIDTLIAHSRAAEAVMIEAADEPPGMTPGQAIILCLDEALAREGDELWQAVRDNLTFDEARDSNGTFWPTFADMATKVGTSVAVLLRELAGSGYIDYSMTPGSFALNAYVHGARNSGRSAAFYSPTTSSPASGNLLRLKRTGEA